MSVAVMDRSGELERRDHFHAIEVDGVAVPFVDLECDCALTMTLRRRRHGLTRTPHIATAILDISAFN